MLFYSRGCAELEKHKDIQRESSSKTCSTVALGRASSTAGAAGDGQVLRRGAGARVFYSSILGAGARVIYSSILQHFGPPSYITQWFLQHFGHPSYITQWVLQHFGHPSYIIQWFLQHFCSRLAVTHNISRSSSGDAHPADTLRDPLGNCCV